MKRQKLTTVKCPDCGLLVLIETRYLITQPIENQCQYCLAVFEIGLTIKRPSPYPKG